MRSIIYKLLFFASGIFFPSCNNSVVYDQKLKTLDSLSGALNAMVNKLEKTDTVLLNKAIDRFENYKLFIQNNIQDTINKSQADLLRQFYTGGTNLRTFKENRTSILKQASVVNSQIFKLSGDIKEHSIELELMNQYVSLEQKQTGELIESIYKQQNMFFSSIEEFKLSLRSVEQLIKEHNNGELPTITQEDQAF